ncbi:MMPL family transporter [Embleya sp. NPDC005575]|uniref:MMPL family transporter n=1 Tax=Embleya sp. NPDC005575 TaxID=3156892 RepID=UPI0033BB3A2D
MPVETTLSSKDDPPKLDVRNRLSPTPFAVRHRVLVSALALLVTVLAGFVGHDVASLTSSGGLVPPDAESLRAEELLNRGFGAGTPDLIALARVRAPGRDVDAPEAAAAARLVEERLGSDREVTRVSSYWSTASANLRSADGRAALILAWFRGDEAETARIADRLTPRIAGRTGPLTVSVGGEAAVRAMVDRQSARDTRTSELVALPVTATLLLLVFGSMVAAALPVAVGVFAVLGTTAVLRALSDHTHVSVYALSISAALAFALTIDYSLFLVSRFREERRKGQDSTRALHTTMHTAGRAVAFSAATVACGMATLLVFPHPMLRSIACGGVVVTAMAALGSLVVLPAALALLGDRLERFDVFARRRRASATTRPQDREPLGAWGRIAMVMMRHPLAAGIPVVCVVLLLAAPFTQARFSAFDDRVLPVGADSGRVGDALREDFPDGALRATTVVLPQLDGRTRAGELDDYARRISLLGRVARVHTATGVYRAGSNVAAPTPESARFLATPGAYLSVVTRGDPTDPEVAQAIRKLPSPALIRVGGPGARVADVRGPIAARLPLALTLVALTMFVLVLALTRRPVLAIKALALNTLSLCATFGALVLVFQQGHLRWLVGDFPVTGTMDVLLPIVVFCIAFGLSMDYECILLSRIVEEHRTGADTVTAVARGVDRTGRLFTWSATILAAVMVALATSGLIFLKAVGVGLALAALLDATVVRGLLVPAVMRLAGRANWWTPTRPRKAKTAGSVRDRRWWIGRVMGSDMAARSALVKSTATRLGRANRRSSA